MTLKEKLGSFFRKFKAQEIAAIAGVLTFVIVNIFSFAAKCSTIRTEVLRLHVIANSDSQLDQEMKLAVRDKILTAGAEIFDGSVTSADAEVKITPQIDTLVKAAEEIVSTYGSDYGVEIKITEEYFDTRSYENITLPAGKYMALKVVIGEGAGQNWWCVMFPPLCLPAAEATDDADMNMVFDDEETKLLESSPKYEIRFKIVEIYEKLVAKIKK